MLAYNEQKGQNEYQPIQQVFINQDPQITFLQVDQELVTTTPEHPFYVKERSDTEARPKPIGHEDLNDHWIGAGHLKVGDKIQKADGGFGVVKYVNTVTQTRTMYNLEVREAHTFFVGTQGWLVHNADGSNAARRQAMREAGIPTSSQPFKTFKTAEGLAYEYHVPKRGGGIQKMIVNFQDDALHGPHWEVGSAKLDDNGNVRIGKSGAPKYYNELPDGRPKIRVEFGCL